MRNAYKIGALAIAGSLALAACGSSSGSGGSSSGGSGKTVVISTDLPLQGSSKDASDATNQAIELYLEQIGGKAGDYNIELKKYDDSTAAKGSWDDAHLHEERAGPRGQRRTRSPSWAPTTRAAPRSRCRSSTRTRTARCSWCRTANTNPGLTKTWDPGEPDKYYPTGKRNYARVVTTDDYQGRGRRAVRGQGPRRSRSATSSTTTRPTARASRRRSTTEAPKQGIEVLGNEAWDAKQPNYTALFQKIKGLGRRLHLPRRHLRQQRWPADQGQGRGPGRQHRGQADRPGRLHRLPRAQQAARGARACT